MTRGVTPYDETYEKVENWQLCSYLKSGRLPKTKYCPHMLYSILQNCWHFKSNLRSTSELICKQVQKVVTQLKKADKYSKIVQNVPYVNVPAHNH